MKKFARKFVAVVTTWMSTRVHCYNKDTWQVQRWDYDSDPACRMLGKMWGTVYCDDAIAQRLGIHPRMFALFDTKAEAKAYLREYRKRLVSILTEVTHDNVRI